MVAEVWVAFVSVECWVHELSLSLLVLGVWLLKTMKAGKVGSSGLDLLGDGGDTFEQAL